MKPIHGVMLVRDEDLLAPWAVLNALDFCDDFLVLDNGSVDGTRPALEAIAAASPKLRIETVPDAYDTHRFIEPLAETDCWVLGVDGDELYDPEALAALRPRLLAGAFDRFWRLRPHTCHPWRLDLDAGLASAFASPPNRTMDKLFNFSAIDHWRQGRHERLHGKNIGFRPGFSADLMWDERETTAWDDSPFRCMHLCFMPRSSARPEGDTAPNPAELRKRAKPLRRLRDGVMGALGLTPPKAPDYKTLYYGQGPLIDHDVRAFADPRRFGPLHPLGAAAAQAIAAVSARRGG